MIGKLRGIVDSIFSDKIILDVSGVGYLINCSSKTLSKIAGVGEAESLLIHMQVKEDDISLYGFKEAQELEWFNNLVTVQGIGTRLALTILSFLTADELIYSISNRTKENFKQISGVGPKLVERIFTELTKKANNYSIQNPLTNNPKLLLSQENSNNINDALNALTNLGYNRNEAYNIAKLICQNNPDISINDLIRAALKELSS